MPRIDHIAVAARDARVSAAFYAEVFDLPAPVPSGPFLAVHVDDTFTLDFAAPPVDFPGQHYAFHVTDAEFDAIRARLESLRVTYWPGPRPSDPGTINHHHGGRGLYFDDPAGHHLEIITAHYGSG